MKKIIALAIAAVTFVSASFALDFEIGGRFFMGTNLGSYTFDAIQSNTDTAKEQLKKTTFDSKLDYGFGAYANFALFGGLGVQAEADLTKGSASIKNLDKAQKYEVWTLDMPIMVWANFDLWRLTIGAGAGVNFSCDLQSGNLKSLYEQTAANAKENMLRTGFVCGADAKFFITKHIGIVASGRYIMDFAKKEVPVTVNGYDTDHQYPTIEFSRRSLYGGLGIEWKFF